MVNLQLPVSVKQKIATAKMPVIYEQACRELAACRTIDEAIYFDNKADALAAWAKIHNSNQACVEARRLKLHAYRRMGQLAAELRPQRKVLRAHGQVQGTTPGAKSLLLEHGLPIGVVTAARGLARLAQEKFDEAINVPRPMSPVVVLRNNRSGSQSWKLFKDSAANALQFRGFCRRNSAAELAHGLTLDEAELASKVVTELSEWLDTFERHLPKVKP